MEIIDHYLRDDQGRILLLRGCNLGGSSKVPAAGAGEGAAGALQNPARASFVGRPFPAEEAEAHFRRLRKSGLSFVRFLITWEALEHQGPGIYDEAYLAHLRKILLAAEKEGIALFMDPHQDVWSRWTGGDGAPAWTLEKLGMDLDRLDAAGAALTRERWGEFHPGTPYPPMIWPVNYSRYGAATLFSLFFGGNAYAPGLEIEGEPAQDWLQEKYLAAMRHCFRRLKNCRAIAGWGTMNEPHPGFIGCGDLRRSENEVLALGPLPSPFEAMLAASGHPVSVGVYEPGLRGRRLKGRETLNPGGLSIFKPGFVCPWQRAGVWTAEGGEARLLRPDHFSHFQGRKARFADDFLKPFMVRFIERMRGANEKALFFVEGVPQGEQPSWTAGDPPGVVHAFHWYDGPTLFTKRFRPWLTVDLDRGRLVLGRKRAAACFVEALRRGAAWSGEHMGGLPALAGEFGLPFDLNGGRAFRTGDYRLHEEALSRYYDALDANLLHGTIWNYTPDNTPAAGDHWNGEDLSIFSAGKFRAEGGWRRPYPLATAGKPRFLRWDRKRARFHYRFQADPAIEAPTEIYAPPECFGPAPAISLSGPGGKAPAGPRWEYQPEEGRLFVWNGGFGGEVELVVRGCGTPPRHSPAHAGDDAGRASAQ